MNERNGEGVERMHGCVHTCIFAVVAWARVLMCSSCEIKNGIDKELYY